LLARPLDKRALWKFSYKLMIIDSLADESQKV
jgi:hypothetical protein